ncbi:Mitochondrial substrate/solute carrier [Penicillium taxi]|uniref:Mitochondrial substrate/solute carrier n=1 Tax=Penicillium taxi TaxID=168475 RepID=UPI002545B04D|nr:Mitochondrial substrate/solute carrier [Penicillium taxi]KAJ5899638.1 Mitochondrial substrate/solute carrier [Penicillium taxi]
MAEYKLSYESQLDAFHPSYRWESQRETEDWKTAALRGPGLPLLGNAVAGAVGSAISNVAIYPLSVIVARLQTQKTAEGSKGKPDEEEYTDLVDAARKIHADEGFAGFYPGLTQDTCKAIADSFLFFLAYSIVRQRRIVARIGAARAAKSKNIILPILDELVIGVVAGAFSKLFTTPLSNIVTRKQTGARKDPTYKNLSTREIASRICAEKGLRGLWSGYSASLVLTLNPSITFFLNEVLKRAFIPRSKGGKASIALTFLLAAMSKAAASSMTYPFSLAKTRAQAMSGSMPPTNKGKGRPSTLNTIKTTLTPKILSAVLAIHREEGTAGLYTGLSGEVLKSFFSHGFTMLAKDAVYASIVKMYYLLLVILRRYPSPDDLLARAREQVEEYSEIAREGARDLAERTRESAENVLASQAADKSTSFAVASAKVGIDAMSSLKGRPDEVNETAELVGDYVEDEAAEWKTFYHWFWEKNRED